MTFSPSLRAAVLACLATLAACSEEKPAENAGRTAGTAEMPDGRSAPVPAGSGFDFYVLSLSWSPTWCGNNDRDGASRQCAAGRDHAFIVHGLWPQNETGYPEFCRSRDPDRVPEALGRTMFDLIPSMGLIGHQWRKHGSCSGLSQKDYFAAVRAARKKVEIPAVLDNAGQRRAQDWDEIEKAVIAANPGMRADGVSVACDGNELQDLRICMTRDLDFTSCPEVDRKACRKSGIILPAAR